MSSRKNRRAQQQQKNRNLIIGAVAALAVIVLLAIFLNRQGNGIVEHTLPEEISVSEAAGRREAGAFILDVREQSEWDEFHIPGATLIPLGELAGRLDEVPTDQEVVVVCRSGNRSQSGRDILLDAGLTQVTSMAGGMVEWSSSGYPTVSGP